MARIASRFTRVEPRRRVRRLISGLLSDLPRKNCWTLAEHVSGEGPGGAHPEGGMAAALGRSGAKGERYYDRANVVIHGRTDRLGRPSATRGIFVVSPPRDRPMA
ncbi:hypothetical protein ABZ468_44035 [Streptomyces sp. NPDC005708]|uniref:hypothetical protein n=1 Tax=unclassified Streptomyces TaxID=2593676 RepID=UPI0033F17E15